MEPIGRVIVILVVNLTFEMLTVRDNILHFQLTNGCSCKTSRFLRQKCLEMNAHELPTFGLIPNAVSIWSGPDICCPMLKVYRRFCSKVSIWTVGSIIHSLLTNECSCKSVGVFYVENICNKLSIPSPLSYCLQVYNHVWRCYDADKSVRLFTQ